MPARHRKGLAPLVSTVIDRWQFWVMIFLGLSVYLTAIWAFTQFLQSDTANLVDAFREIITKLTAWAVFLHLGYFSTALYRPMRESRLMRMLLMPAMITTTFYPVLGIFYLIVTESDEVFFDVFQMRGTFDCRGFFIYDTMVHVFPLFFLWISLVIFKEEWRHWLIDQFFPGIHYLKGNGGRWPGLRFFVGVFVSTAWLPLTYFLLIDEVAAYHYNEIYPNWLSHVIVYSMMLISFPFAQVSIFLTMWAILGEKRFCTDYMRHWATPWMIANTQRARRTIMWMALATTAVSFYVGAVWMEKTPLMIAITERLGGWTTVSTLAFTAVLALDVDLCRWRLIRFVIVPSAFIFAFSSFYAHRATILYAGDEETFFERLIKADHQCRMASIADRLIHVMPILTLLTAFTLHQERLKVWLDTVWKENYSLWSSQWLTRRWFLTTDDWQSARRLLEMCFLFANASLGSVVYILVGYFLFSTRTGESVVYEHYKVTWMDTVVLFVMTHAMGAFMMCFLVWHIWEQEGFEARVAQPLYHWIREHALRWLDAKLQHVC